MQPGGQGADAARPATSARPPEFPDGYVPKQSDNHGHYHVVVGNMLGDRYRILRLAGEGNFSKVCECVDTMAAPGSPESFVAVKVVRDVDDYRRDAEVELGVLQYVASLDPHDSIAVVKHMRHFMHGGHLCIVFQRYGGSLLDFMQKHATFLLEWIAHIALRLFRALTFLHDYCGLIHTDLKPENILLETRGYSHSGRRRIPRSQGIRVVDLGGAVYGDGRPHASLVSTRHYRAPEVVLSQGWSYPCDVWSAGCLLVELLTGKLLFDTHENREHLAMMQRVLPHFPRCRPETLNPDAARYFRPDGALKWPEIASSDASVAAVEALTPLSARISDPDFLDLLLLCLTPDPSRRITARAALTHRFILKYADRAAIEAIPDVLRNPPPPVPPRAPHSRPPATGTAAQSGHQQDSAAHAAS